MDLDGVYARQVRLLLQALPYLEDEPCFALKGGTAINLFHLPMPRLSVDIDLTYLPIEDRETSLASARDALARIVDFMVTSSPRLNARMETGSDDLIRARVMDEDIQIKIELNPVLRGAIADPVRMEVHSDVQETFGYAEVAVLRRPDLYGGKICAALDRQHPRDLFDIHMLLREGGLTRDVFEGFLVYLISHGRPMSELLKPVRKDIRRAYETSFAGMTRNPVSLETLEAAFDALLARIAGLMNNSDRRFLISVKRGEPDWSLLPIEGIEHLPAVQWKLLNIRRMSVTKHNDMLKKLEYTLENPGTAR